MIGKREFLSLVAGGEALGRQWTLCVAILVAIRPKADVYVLEEKGSVYTEHMVSLCPASE